MPDDDGPFQHFVFEPSYSEFERFMHSNTPCTFGPWISASWGCTKDWVKDDGNPNLEYLGEHYGDEEVTVHAYEDEGFECTQETLAEFISYWKSLIMSIDPPRHDNDFPKTYTSLPRYMKDWHFGLCIENKDHVYSVPAIFTDDWLNFHLDFSGGNDYIFSYFGPAGSFTPFHADVFRSYSWSVNVCGKKKWLILYPGEESKLEENGYNVFDQCIRRNLRHVVLIQNPGEGIFVPSGWWHQVLNLEDTISINHNWCNFHCIPRMWNYFEAELAATEAELRSFGCHELMSPDEWTTQCHIVLRANIGMGFPELVRLILINVVRIFGKKHLDHLQEVIPQLTTYSVCSEQTSKVPDRLCCPQLYDMEGIEMFLRSKGLGICNF